MKVLNNQIYVGAPAGFPKTSLNCRRLVNLQQAYDFPATESKTRVHLMDLAKSQKMSRFCGIVIDVRESKHGPMLLLSCPCEFVERGTKYLKMHQLDSHIWLNVNDILTAEEPFTIALGDILFFYGYVKEYHKRRTHETKYGFSSVAVYKSGIPIDGNYQHICDDYPKHDIIVKTTDKFKLKDDYHAMLDRQSVEELNNYYNDKRFEIFKNPYGSYHKYLNAEESSLNNEKLKQNLKQEIVEAYKRLGAPNGYQRCFTLEDK